MGNAWEPGNPKGWGDPTPIVLVILLLVILGATVDRYGNFVSSQQQCDDVLQRSTAGQ